MAPQASTQSFSYPPCAGWPKFVSQDASWTGSKGITTGMQAALDRIESVARGADRVRKYLRRRDRRRRSR